MTRTRCLRRAQYFLVRVRAVIGQFNGPRFTVIAAPNSINPYKYFNKMQWMFRISFINLH